MKITHLLVALCAIVLSTLVSFGQDKRLTTATFPVSGNCGMCKKTIESSLKGKPGIGTADWNVQTKLIQVTYDPSLITDEEIHRRISDAGYDTEKKKAPDKAYNGLMECCKYKRTMHAAAIQK